MIVETCPLFKDIKWLKHGFYGGDNPCAQTPDLKSIHRFNDDFPHTLFMKQNHTNAIITTAEETLHHFADAIITGEDHLALAVKTADCCPILLVCTYSRQIAAIHAGWPGALNRITEKTVEKFIMQGAKPGNIIAAIGPYIHAETYPVQDDVRDKFNADQPEAFAFFARFEDRWKLDVAGIVKLQLQACGIMHIWQSRINTFTDLRYASYRRDHDIPKTRNVSVIMKIK